MIYRNEGSRGTRRRGVSALARGENKERKGRKLLDEIRRSKLQRVRISS